MRTASYSAFGPAKEVLTLSDMEPVAPGQGEVRVRLATSGVNPSDVKQRAAIVKRPVTFPVIPHSDGAGVIEEVGTNVDSGRVGERVWVYNAQFQRSHGTSADYVTLPADCAVRLADNTDFAAGACFGIPALTAWYTLHRLQPVVGTTVLVQGGAGAVGHYIVQIAKEMGASVIATVSSDEKAAHARTAGADHTVNYRSEKLGERIKELTDGKGVERVAEVEFATNSATYFEILARNATAAIYGVDKDSTTFRVNPFLALQPTLHFYNVYMMPAEPRARAIAYLTEMCEQDRLQHTIAARYPLEEIAAAHEAVESGSLIGNVVLDIADLD